MIAERCALGSGSGLGLGLGPSGFHDAVSQLLAWSSSFLLVLLLLAPGSILVPSSVWLACTPAAVGPGPHSLGLPFWQSEGTAAPFTYCNCAISLSSKIRMVTFEFEFQGPGVVPRRLHTGWQAARLAL